jgi:hypothetical protein
LEYLSSLNSDQNEVRSKLGISKEVGSLVVTGSEDVSVQRSEGEVRTSLNKKKKTTVDAFVMTDDWEPSDNFPEIVLSGLGLDVTPEGKHNWLLKRALMENRMYYQSGEMVTRTNNQHGWHRCLIYQMKVIYKAKKDEMSSKGSNVVPIAKAANAYRKKQDGSLIPRVPNFVDQKAMLDWWKQHAKLGAPSVSAKRYNDYKEWRYDLDQWRTNHLLELKKKEQG